jgi:hypothetical protein
MLASWTVLNKIKVSVKNKGLLSSAGQNSARCPGSGADNLKTVIVSLNFEASSKPPADFFPISQLCRL